MNEIIEKDIENMIYEIRGKQVMLDSDLARLYGCANGTKTINQAVSRHKVRFPERFVFQLTRIEYDNLRFQLGTANNMRRVLPYVFTGIIKGRWYEETIPLFEKHNIVMDWSKRGLLSEVKPETFCQKTKRRMGRVPRYLIAYLDLFKLSVGRNI